jgi:hypothetical protein
MITIDNQISLTYTVGGECIKKFGVYTVADVTVRNGFTKNEVFILNKPSQTIKPAEFNYSQTSITLGKAFIEGCLEAPTKPKDENYHRWLRTPLGQLSQMWKKMSVEQKIKYHIDLYVKDMGGYDYTYEIL